MKILLLFVFASYFITAFAQPGWEDFTTRSTIYIKDENGRLIDFTHSPAYSIILDSVNYSGITIPKDSFSIPIWNKTSEFNRQITINDFRKELPDADHNISFTIVRGRDSMHIALEHRRGQDGLNLQFTPGYFFIPRWGKDLLNKTFPLSSTANIINRNQEFLQVEKDWFYRNNKDRGDSIGNYFRRKTEKDFIRFNISKTPVKFENSFGRKPAEINEYIWPTADTNLVVVNTRFSSPGPNKYIITYFNKQKNSMRFFLPDGTADSVYYSYIIPDTFNHSYLSVIHVQEGYPAKRKVYQSSADKLNWKPEKAYTKMHHDVNFYFRVFVDKEHLIGYRQDTSVKPNGASVYYLIKNRKIIDSIQMKQSYSSDVNGFAGRDTFVLSTFFGYEGVKGNDFALALVHHNNVWKFTRVSTNSDVRSATYTHRKLRDYQNFYQKSDSLFWQRDSTFFINAYSFVAERDSMIIAASRWDDVTLFSFDKGISWIFYPGKIIDSGYYNTHFWEIDDKGRLVFWKFSTEFEKVVAEIMTYKNQ